MLRLGLSRPDFGGHDAPGVVGGLAKIQKAALVVSEVALAALLMLILMLMLRRHGHAQVVSLPAVARKEFDDLPTI